VLHCGSAAKSIATSVFARNSFKIAGTHIAKTRGISGNGAGFWQQNGLALPMSKA
jgi:hypothetical protein